jgi:beta-phosphoglucomutase
MTVTDEIQATRHTPPSLVTQEGEGFGVIWDMDGTMVDTAELHFQAWRETAAELGRPFTREDFQATFGRRNPDILHILFGQRFTAAEFAAVGDLKEEKYRAAARSGVELLPGVRDLLQALHASGFRQAIGSSAPRANLDLILELTGTQRYFQSLVGMEDVQRGKPDPQVFLVAAQRLQLVPENCLILEDALAGIQAAKAGGMKSIAVRFVGHHGEEALREAGAEMVVHTLKEVSVVAVRRLWAQ